MAAATGGISAAVGAGSKISMTVTSCSSSAGRLSKVYTANAVCAGADGSSDKRLPAMTCASKERSIGIFQPIGRRELFMGVPFAEALRCGGPGARGVFSFKLSGQTSRYDTIQQGWSDPRGRRAGCFQAQRGVQKQPY